jgi:hypothetical protein
MPVLLSVALAGSCTSGPEAAPRRSAPSPVPLAGTLLAVGGGTPSIVRYAFPGGTVARVPSPIDAEAANRGSFAGVATGDGDATLVATVGGDARAWTLAPGAEALAPAAGPLPLGHAEEPTLALEGATAAVATCAGVWSASIGTGGPWRRVGSGCWTAVGPNGEIAFSPDAERIVAAGADGRGPRTLVRLDGLRGSLGVDATPDLIGNAAWDEGDGLAFTVRAGDQAAVFVRAPDGRTREVLQERYANTFRAPRLAWRPGGGLLAIADDVGPGGSVLRIFDPTSDELRAIALDPLGFSGLAWAPDGSSIALLTGSSALLVLDPDGRWLDRVATDWKGLVAWTVSAP